MDTLKLWTVCINLERRPERWATFNNQINKHGLSVERFLAIDGKNSLEPVLQEYGLIPKNSASSAEKGCFLSHYSVWRKLSQSNFDAALVFEDDAVFVDNFSENLQKILHEIQSRGLSNYLIYLGYEDLRSANLEAVNDVHLEELSRFCQCHAYIISRGAALAVVENTKYARFSPDIELVTKLDFINAWNTTISISHQDYTSFSDLQQNSFWHQKKLEFYINAGFSPDKIHNKV